MALYAARSAGLHALAIGHGFELPPSREPRPCFTPWFEGSIVRALEWEVLLTRSLVELAQLVPVVWRTKAPTSIDELYHPQKIALCAWP